MAARNLFLLSLLVLVICCVSCSGAEGFFSRLKRQIPTSSIAVDAALRNPRFMRRQINCLLNESSCDSIGRSLKQMTPSLIRGQCPGCSQQQFQQAMRVMNHVSRQYPAEYSRIYSTYAG